jgi:hypothetical protein
MPERTSASLSHQDPEAANSFRLLSARRKRPRHRAAKQRNELAPVQVSKMHPPALNIECNGWASFEAGLSALRNL